MISRAAIIKVAALLVIFILLGQAAAAASPSASGAGRSEPGIVADNTFTPTSSPTDSATPTLIASTTLTVTTSATRTPTANPTLTATATISLTPTASATITTTPTPTMQPSATPNVTPSATPTAPPTATITPTATLTPTATPGLTYNFDVVVEGGTSAGVGAAIAAARQGAHTVLLADGSWLGGMISAGGVGASDTSSAASSGLFEEFRLRVRDYYTAQRNAGLLQCLTPAPVVVDNNYANPTIAGAIMAKLLGGTYDTGYAVYTWNMTDGKCYLQMRNLECNTAAHYPVSGFNYEPAVAAQILYSMTLAEPNLTVMLNSPYSGVITDSGAVAGVNVLTATGGLTVTASVRGKVVIDATERGDVLADAGTLWQDYVFGREPSASANNAPPQLLSRSYNEFDAGKTYVVPLVGGSVGDGDYGLMAYSYLLTLEYAPQRPLIVNPFANIPDSHGHYGDQNEIYISYANSFAQTAAGEWNDIWYQWRRFLPNNKLEINLTDLPSANYVSLDSPANYLTDPSSRAAIDQKHRLYALSFLYWAQSHVDAAQGWRPALDYGTADGAPLQMYVREGYRLVGLKTAHEQDFGCTSHVCNPNGPAFITDSIAAGQYAMDSHTVQYFTDSYGAHNEGQYWIGNQYPYQVSYGVMVPQRIDGLLAPLAVSASHVGYSALRMEAIRMALGQAAGVAAAMAAAQNIQPRTVNIGTVQRNLITQGAALYTYSDVPPNYWAWPQIQHMTAQGIVRGSSVPNTFAPERQITRAELAKMLDLAEGWALTTPSTPDFSDVPASYWAYAYIETANAHGAISGYPGGTFHPNQPVTRAQMARMVVRAAGYDTATPGTPTFADVPASYWAYGYIEAAKIHNLMSGVDATHFQPDGNLTRAQAAKTVYVLMVARGRSG